LPDATYGCGVISYPLSVINTGLYNQPTNFSSKLISINISKNKIVGYKPLLKKSVCLNIMKEFFEMGGYAFYVWMSYGLTLIILIANLIMPINHEHTLLRTFARKLRRKRRDHNDANA